MLWPHTKMKTKKAFKGNIMSLPVMRNTDNQSMAKKYKRYVLKISSDQIQGPEGKFRLKIHMSLLDQEMLTLERMQVDQMFKLVLETQHKVKRAKHPSQMHREYNHLLHEMVEIKVIVKTSPKQEVSLVTNRRKKLRIILYLLLEALGKVMGLIRYRS